VVFKKASRSGVVVECWHCKQVAQGSNPDNVINQRPEKKGTWCYLAQLSTYKDMSGSFQKEWLRVIYTRWNSLLHNRHEINKNKSNVFLTVHKFFFCQSVLFMLVFLTKAVLMPLCHFDNSLKYLILFELYFHFCYDQNPTCSN